MHLNFTRTRIAPTPSGFLHLGNVLSFSITAYLAKQTGAQILLRIDDLDRERVSKEYVDDIFETLNFLAIPWDEGPRNYQEFEQEFSQVHRMKQYEKMLSRLKEQQAVFACTCSRSQVLAVNSDGAYPGTCRDKRIPLDTKDACWRLFTDKSELPVKATDGSTTVAVLPDLLKDFVVRKKDGHPAYQLASLADDLYWQSDLVVRGRDLWPSTLAQQFLAQVLGEKKFQGVRFFHHPLLANADGQKFSKSAGDTSVQFLRRQGKKPAEIFRMIGQMMKMVEPCADWAQLAGAVMQSVR